MEKTCENFWKFLRSKLIERTKSCFVRSYSFPFYIIFETLLLIIMGYHYLVFPNNLFCHFQYEL